MCLFQRLQLPTYRGLMLAIVVVDLSCAGLIATGTEPKELLERAARVAMTINDTDTRDDRLILISDAQVLAGDGRAAVTSALSMTDSPFRVVGLLSIASVQHQSGDAPAAKETVRLAARSRFFSSYDRVNSLVSTGQLKKAAAQLPQVDKIHQPSAGSLLVKACIRQGKYDQALDLTHDFRGLWDRGDLLEIAVQFAREGQRTRAQVTLDWALQHRGERVPAHVLAEVENVEIALKEISNLSDPEAKATNLARVAIVQARRGRRDDALKSLCRARELAHEESTLLDLLESELEVGDRSSALQTCEKLKEPDSLAIAVALFVDACDFDNVHVPVAALRNATINLEENDPFRELAVHCQFIMRGLTSDCRGALHDVDALPAPKLQATALLGLAQGIAAARETADRHDKKPGGIRGLSFPKTPSDDSTSRSDTRRSGRRPRK